MTAELTRARAQLAVVEAKLAAAKNAASRYYYYEQCVRGWRYEVAKLEQAAIGGAA